MSHKICPKCQSAAQLEATFCGQCGRQYRTQFVTGGEANVGTSPIVRTDQAFGNSPSPTLSHIPRPAPSSLGGRGNPGERNHSVQTPGAAPIPNTKYQIPAAIVVMSVIVAALILMVTHRNRPGEYTVQTPRSAERPLAPPQSPTDTDAASMVKRGEDPIEEEAKRVVDRDNARLQNSPPASAIGPDGRVHLRGGGSITREQWDDANKRLRNSPEFRDPMPPPPVN